jgi:uncharacterized protein (TIGR00251 family)
VSVSRARLLVHVQPRAKREEIAGWQGERLRLRVTAPPVEGAANEAVVRLLADALGVRRSQITFTRGAKSREKTVVVEGLSEEVLRKRLPVQRDQSAS